MHAVLLWSTSLSSADVQYLPHAVLLCSTSLMQCCCAVPSSCSATVQYPPHAVLLYSTLLMQCYCVVPPFLPPCARWWMFEESACMYSRYSVTLVTCLTHFMTWNGNEIQKQRNELNLSVALNNLTQRKPTLIYIWWFVNN